MRKLRIKEVLIEKGVSQGKLSRGSDVPQETIRRMIRDPYYNAQAYTLMRIAEYLGVTLDDLYEKIDPGSE